MDKIEIKRFLDSFQEKRGRTIVVVDYGNVEKCQQCQQLRESLNAKGRQTGGFSLK